jgi:hypothetical protein
MRLGRLFGWAAGAVLGLVGVAQSADLFVVNAQTTSGTPASLTVTGHNLSDLVTNLVQSRKQFAALNGRDASATLQYGGIRNAITITKNAASTAATVTIPSIGLTKTFGAASADDLKNQIIDYVRQNGASDYGRFLRVVNQSTVVGVADGNPLAATSMLAGHQYFTFGLQPAPWPVASPQALDTNSAANVRFDASAGAVREGGGNGYFASGAFDVAVRFAAPVNLVFSTPFLYRNFEGSNTYEVGEEVALPIGIIPPKGSDSLSWTLTPAGMAGAAGSLELAAGGTFAGGGITSSLSYQIGSLTFTLADHYSYFRGYPIHVGDYSFETDLEQQILKNGLKITQSFGDALFLDASITHTDLLNRADVRRWWTPGAGIGVRFDPHAGIRVGYSGDFARGYTSNGGNVQVYFNY